jgi:hypothetical protein
MELAISYRRFSTPTQADGASTLPCFYTFREVLRPRDRHIEPGSTDPN